VINLPTGINAIKHHHVRLGKSKNNGVHFVVVDDQSRLQVWFLHETSDRTDEWVLKHSANLGAMKLLPKDTDTPWILQNGNYDQGSKREMDWQSDDDNAVDIEELDKQYSCPYYIEVFGFHPYGEIIFLFLRCTYVNF
jgi:hypothetical protein